MAKLNCPSCSVTLPPKDIQAGWCDSCGNKIPATLLSQHGAAKGSKSGGTDPARGKWAGRKGQLICTIIGAAIYAVLMVGPLKGLGYVPILGVGVGILLVCGLIGMGIDRLNRGDD